MKTPIEILRQAIMDGKVKLRMVSAPEQSIAALEAAGIRLLSAEGVTDEMFLAIDAINNTIERDEFNAMWRAILAAAPLFGKGSEKP